MNWNAVIALLKRVYLDWYYYLFPLHRLRKSGATIGQQVFWGKNISVELENAHLLTIEDNATISAHTSFILHDSSLQKIAGFDLLYGKIVIQQGAYIGAHTIILPGSKVGAKTIVGANSLVKGQLKAHSVYWGQPARRHGSVTSLLRKWQTRRRHQLKKSPTSPLLFFRNHPEEWRQSSSSRI